MVDGVVLIHGMARTPSSMRFMAQALAREGYKTLNLGYNSRRRSLHALADEIHPEIVAFEAEMDGSLHFVTHSMGGLLARVYLASRRPARLGRVVMLGPPNNGSEVADLLHRSLPFRLFFGPAGQELTTEHAGQLRTRYRPLDCEVGVIAGTRSMDLLSSALVLREPNDGKVTVDSTRLDEMTDHLTLPVTHSFMMRNRKVVASTLGFLREGRFG